MRRLLAGSALTIGLLAASLAWWGFTLDRTVGNPSRTADVVDVLLADQAVRDGFADATALAVDRVLPAAARAGLTEEQLDAAARAAVLEPGVQDALRTTLTQVHAYVVGDLAQPPVLAAGPLDAAVRAQLTALRPDLAPAIAAMPALAIPLPDRGLEITRSSRDLLGDATRIAAIVAAVAVGVALLTSRHRSATMRQTGWWALLTGGLWVLLRFAVPPLAAELLPGQAGLLGGLATAASESMLWPGLVLLAAGNVLFLAGSLVDWAARERRVHADHRPPSYADGRWAQATMPTTWDSSFVAEPPRIVEPGP